MKRVRVTRDFGATSVSVGGAKIGIFVVQTAAALVVDVQWYTDKNSHDEYNCTDDEV